MGKKALHSTVIQNYWKPYQVRTKSQHRINAILHGGKNATLHKYSLVVANRLNSLIL